MRLLLLLFLLAAWIEAKILVNMMDSSHSHLKSIMPIIERTQEHGHHFHFMESTCFNKPYSYPRNASYTLFQLPMDSTWSDIFLPLLWIEEWGSKEATDMWSVGDRNFQFIYKAEKPRLLDVFNATWDMVFGDELFTPSVNALALKARREHGTPFIMAATCVMLHSTRYHLALGGTPVSRPSKFIGQGRQHRVDAFISRLRAFGSEIIDHYQVDHVVNHLATKTYELLGLSNFHLSQISQESSFYFADELVPLVWPEPTSTQVIQVGYNCEESGTLSTKYVNFVEDKKSKGTILMAFGSNVQWNYAPKELLKKLIGAFNLLKDYRIVFSFNGNASLVEELGLHVMVTRWAPQKQLLHHNRTKLFISHGGLKSLKDSICGTVPLLIIPLFAEQPLSGEFVRQAGIGDLFLKWDITPESFSAVISKVAETPDYKRNVVKMKSYFLDRPIDNLDHASYAINRALKTGNRYPIFKIKGMFQSLFVQFYGAQLFGAIVLMCSLF